MPSQTAPCGATVEAESQAQMGSAYSAHQNGCSECQQKLAALRDEWFGGNDKDPRDY